MELQLPACSCSMNHSLSYYLATRGIFMIVFEYIFRSKAITLGGYNGAITLILMLEQ